MKRITIIMVMFALAAFLLLTACKSPVDDQKVKVRQPSKEESIMNDLAAGKLIAVFEEEMTISPGNKGTNRLAIKNAYDKSTKFNIEICQDCEFAETGIQLSPNEAKIIEFTVKGVPGEKTLVIRDSLNNFYAKESFTVTN